MCSEPCNLCAYKCAQTLWSLRAWYHTLPKMSIPPASQNPHNPRPESPGRPLNTHTWHTPPIGIIITSITPNGERLCQLRIHRHRSSVIESLWKCQFWVTSTRIRLTGRNYSNSNQVSGAKHTLRISIALLSGRNALWVLLT